MDHKLISYTMKLTLALALCTYMVFGFYRNYFDAIGILLGACWGITNLYFLKKSLEEVLKLQGRDNLVVFALLQIKFPLLYLIGYGLFWLRLFPVSTLVTGFSLIFVAIFLLGVVRIVFDRTHIKRGFYTE